MTVKIKKIGRLGVRKSDTSDKRYVIFVTRQGRIACDCMDWIMRRRKHGGDCKHIRRWKEANKGNVTAKARAARNLLKKAGV